MDYIHALKILPADLIKEIQQYVDGQILYIPKVETKKCKWGDNTQTKAYYKERNLELYHRFQNGTSIRDLSTQYHLTPKSIQRILRGMKR